MKTKRVLGLLPGWFVVLAMLLTTPAMAQKGGGQLPRRATTALWATARREADSLRLWVGWAADRAAPGSAVVVSRSGTTAADGWSDTLRLRPVPEFRRLRTLTLPVDQLQGADRVRLREVNSTEAALDVPLNDATLQRPYVVADSAGQPLPRVWARTGEVLRLKFFGLEQPVSVLRYNADFVAALPPMAEGIAPAVSPTLKVVASREVRANDTFRLRPPGLYALRIGAGPLDPLLVEDGGFPETRTAPDLIQPLVYLTARDERQRLYDAPDPKKATDRFWLDVAQGDQELARTLIRTYYGRVTEANRLYSCHKAGWMTDRGMLWVVLGPPPRVEVTAVGEDWVYHDVAGAGGVRFRFRRRPSVFAPDQYELIRDRRHESLWYAATAQWRKGVVVTAVR